MARVLAFALLMSHGLLVVMAGCGHALEASTTQAYPTARQASEPRESAHLHVQIRDIDLPRRVVLRQSAHFHVVSRDRVRFHLRLVHKWREVVDVTSWHATLKDDLGRSFAPEAKEQRSLRHVTRVWDTEPRIAPGAPPGEAARAVDESMRLRAPLESIDVFRGDGDVVFFAPDLLRGDLRRLTLAMSRSGVEYRFTWCFADDPGATPAAAAAGCAQPGE